ncbi:MAG: pilus assembly protein PilP [Polaromonas sp.]|uniref:pilus assembly protein PilP n=1 Tax=Polaromonas sp. TaxID=1869339 RepID=UPI00272F85FE|nr:pilus assembly protein PilP [Polaromonas sp.]MDP1741909.1 pilus assembly protein PilP [Polaromonas sp.]MDP1954350.1 pilus assembly protein PilP [Polaromonas sp.]MDP3357362.1 pilus assembly protein PilP [Polaromonas sp.]MDP3751252.1 pilus assembly protein PilP [Polaromonas sp.]
MTSLCFGPLRAFILATGLCAGLAACGSGEQAELQQWMTEQRAQTKARIEPLPEPTKFSPQAYTQEGAIEPFSSQKLTQALSRDSNKATANAALIAPELNRRKEALEAMPLDAVSMVGSLVKQGQPVALVRVDNLLYQVRVGNYLGQNYGRITKISETEVALREIVQDAGGEWLERAVTIQLQEGSK